MKAAVRFAEYSLTGGFFWLGVFLFLTLLHLETRGDWLTNLSLLWQHWLQHLGRLTGQVQGLQTLSASLTLLVVFATGLILDLLAPFLYAPLEVATMRRMLQADDQQWLTELTRRHRAYLGTTVEDLRDQPSFSWHDPRQALRQRRRYERLRAFLLAHLFVHTPDAHLEDVLDQLRLWRTARALSLSLALLALFLALVVTLAEPGSSASRYGEPIAIVLPSTLFLVSLFINHLTFHRLCTTLFALSYHAQQRISAPPSSPPTA